MKLFFWFSLLVSVLVSFSLNAEVSRSPAVVGGQCDLDIRTTKIQSGSEKVFNQEVTHKVVILSDDSVGCSVMPKKQYPSSTYEENARNEMRLLFQKYPENYSKNCVEHFKAQGLKKSEYVCEEPAIVSMSFTRFGCEKKMEDGTQKVAFAGFTYASVKYQQRGVRIEEKSAELVQKEQCARVNECIEQASEKEMPELKKLSAVACKAELTPVSTARAPALEKDSSFDGNRTPKNNSNSNSNKDEQQKNPEASGSVLK
ncbi:MAG: hypothetical protein PHY93_04845 [Bacteriovorax sp.]|nr:hypothetical protein [Bacteriovorax sp.]